MKRFLAIVLLALPGIAGALEIGNGGVTVDPLPPPVVLDPVTLPEFEVEVTVLENPFGGAVLTGRESEPRLVPIGDLLLLGEPVTLTVEADGILLPAEQFSLE
jgi:hypothetical protein